MNLSQRRKPRGEVDYTQWLSPVGVGVHSKPGPELRAPCRLPRLGPGAPSPRCLTCDYFLTQVQWPAPLYLKPPRVESRGHPWSLGREVKARTPRTAVLPHACPSPISASTALLHRPSAHSHLIREGQQGTARRNLESERAQGPLESDR